MGWDRELTHRSPSNVIAYVIKHYSTDQFTVSFSGAEDVVVIDIVTRLCNDTIQVFTLDTGRLHEETYEFIETVRNRYDIDLQVLSPDANAVNELVRTKGLFSFYDDGHTECCGIRKIMPLQRHLQRFDAWITGQRRDQGTTRSAVPFEQEDKAFSTPDHTIFKFNPLAEWNSEDVWSYIRANEVPVNPLHAKGFLSIGCAPCTRAVRPGEPERSGRWWWEHEDDKECGIHVQNVDPRPIKVH